MITMPFADAHEDFERLRHRLTETGTVQPATLTEDGKPILAVVPCELFETLRQLADLARDPRTLRLAPPEMRQRVLAMAAAKAEELYRDDPTLTDFEAFADEDFFDITK